jgi:hypothetical protein
MSFHKDTGVQHATTEIEIPGQNQLATGIMTVPAGYLQEGKMQKVGVVIGHGLKSEDWRGELLTELAAALAQAGKCQSQRGVCSSLARSAALSILSFQHGIRAYRGYPSLQQLP